LEGLKMSVQDKIGQENDDAQAMMQSARARNPLADPSSPAVLAARIAEAQRLAREEGVEAPEPAGPGMPRRMRSEDRQPFGAQEQQLAHERIPGFRLYWANDTPGRIARFKRAGYEHVLDEEGKPLCRIVDKRVAGGGLQGYLMKIPLKWYYEDMGTQQALRDGQMADIKQGNYGNKPGQNQYVPKQGIVIQDQRR
jgi:hypothetical protein